MKTNVVSKYKIVPDNDDEKKKDSDITLEDIAVVLRYKELTKDAESKAALSKAIGDLIRRLNRVVKSL